MAAENLNYDQMGMTHEHVRQLTPHKGVREILSRVVDCGHPVISQSLPSGHFRLYIKDDGIVHVSGTPSDHRALKSIEGDIRRGIVSAGGTFNKKKKGK